ncbi:TPA: hypothetical protein DCZ46_01595 [Candidatus Campbellbacteria bacterium]|nr:MAG: seg [Candidatus Campbellbacteria bacterium GW2011_OD1_34_28]KKP75224.1 MAG: hypothetical protein UR74_C0001G0080 [Candidatus Campbellbacteria bacterium GW2011_GWD2_35_24]KKP76215.1 MAG: hypothetical protein UR75_C0001G0249 [Candidatus Campbellbacteria bacterium GW2011_GWC2_35_28]KKP77404.1 MAG: hypothetical protein UR76_C0001G0249 [Candidatus Campbellbacteria bacterium GW2011_GWC1_35_31]KKP79333.1 MAG: hypothetical protein UR79_C0001G0249 [Candidatus Campbellbacteria bacterium GW2011_GW
MPNLLPEKNKKEIRNEFILRLLVVFFVFVFFAITIFIISLVPSYNLSVVKKTITLEQVNSLKESAGIEEDILSASILKNENAKVAVLSAVDQNSASKIIEKILEKRPQGVKITDIFYEKNDAGGIDIVVKGNSSSRNILIGFVEKLELEEDFEKIDFPVSNLVKDESMDFSINIYIK